MAFFKFVLSFDTAAVTLCNESKLHNANKQLQHQNKMLRFGYKLRQF